MALQRTVEHELERANGIVDMKKELEKPDESPEYASSPSRRTAPRIRRDDCEGRWQVAPPKSAPLFQRRGLFLFGKRLADELQQPVGLVNSSWAELLVEVWTPPPTSWAKTHRWSPRGKSSRKSKTLADRLASTTP